MGPRWSCFRGAEEVIDVIEVDERDEDHSSRRATLDEGLRRIVWRIVDSAFDCAEDEYARDRLEQRLAFAEEIRAFDETSNLPLEFGSKKKKQPKKKKNKPKQQTLPKKKEKRCEGVEERYWCQRYLFFNLFDLGIELDAESWFSVTPEKIAARIARRAKNTSFVVDAFCGCGGNALQFAKAGHRVLAVDIDGQKLAMAKHNATVYDVSRNVDFLQANSLDILRHIKADMVFLSPPWGGPTYQTLGAFDLRKHLTVKDSNTDVNGLDLVAIAANAAPTSYPRPHTATRPSTSPRSSFNNDTQQTTTQHNKTPISYPITSTADSKPRPSSSARTAPIPPFS